MTSLSTNVLKTILKVLENDKNPKFRQQREEIKFELLRRGLLG